MGSHISSDDNEVIKQFTNNPLKSKKKSYCNLFDRTWKPTKKGKKKREKYKNNVKRRRKIDLKMNVTMLLSLCVFF